MAKLELIDPFVCDEPAIEVSPATSQILKERLATADATQLVTAGEARIRIQKWLSKSSTTKTL